MGRNGCVAEGLELNISWVSAEVPLLRYRDIEDAHCGWRRKKGNEGISLRQPSSLCRGDVACQGRVCGFTVRRGSRVLRP